ncbi:regulator of sigma E protease [Anaerosphaera aminiphila DSM 21120]|uniref:Zinc metalloprotease n=1 Tax=Anaerosphaera aminiphila DSM 21120 TaxID=1120995 RepID=A0A1M5P0U5_9FIRM|nr:RIP metalloprotease RseP [Anaerosphaera aminiphila]SHG95049.1 regulator of sigma E protease [Anaerosphaera aminiphila DSM 21120]
MATLIGSILVFLIVIMLHELGHFTIAKLVGIKVDEFSIGMGPEIFQTQKGETKYSLRILPIGGYVAMDGEDEYSENPRSFNNVSVLKKMAVVVAGVIMNFLLAIIAFFFIASFIGYNTNALGQIVENSPAQYAELKVGDEILSVNNQPTKIWEAVATNISMAKENENITLEVKRGNEILKKEIKPDYKDGVASIGIGPKSEKSFLSSIKYGFNKTVFTIGSVFTTLKLLFQGNVSVDMFAGPVGVIQIIGQQTARGPIYLLNILGIISANLAVMNLLPIPALDGGKLVFLLIESITGKKVSDEIEGRLSFIGFGLLMTLMLYITVFGDLKRIFNW